MRNKRTLIENVRELGFKPDKLALVNKAIEEDVNKGMYDGAVFMIGRHGQLAAHEAIGYSNRELGKKAKKDDIFFIFSITKQFTAIKILMDIDEGKYSLNTPIKDIIPEFGTKGKQNITVKNILTHTSGLNTEVPAGFQLQNLTNIEAVVDVMCKERLQYKQGSLVSYNPLMTFSLLGALVVRNDDAKRSFRQILEEDLFKPLGMDKTALGRAPHLESSLVPVMIATEELGIFEPEALLAINTLINEDSELCSGGAISDAYGVYRFAEMLRRGGEIDGVRILSSSIIKLAASIQTGDMVNHLYDYVREEQGWPEFPANLGLGFWMRGEGIYPTYLGTLSSPSTFGGLGVGSTCFWVDPEKDLTFVFLSAGLLNEEEHVFRLQRISDLVQSAII